MTPILLEYIWLDANENVRSKKRVYYGPVTTTNYKDLIRTIPKWSYDGSSTDQATGTSSDILLEPVNIFIDPFNKNKKYQSYLVLCSNYDMSANPAIGNSRDNLVNMYKNLAGEEALFGIEQEYFLLETDILGRDESIIGFEWSKHEYTDDDLTQGPFYCSIGYGKALGRRVADRHLYYCLDAGISICGYNAEVAPSQWEFQVGPLSPIECSDQLIIARYILERVSEEDGAIVSYYPKLFDTLNGSGGHVNYSTKSSRESGGLNVLEMYCERLGKSHIEDMKDYGEFNLERLSGMYETSNYDTFSWGFSDRGKSIRIPLGVVNDGFGYLEDRRPAANLNPYRVTMSILKSTLK